MATIAELLVEIKVSQEKSNREFAKLKTQLDNTSKSTFSMSKAFGVLGTAIAAIGIGRLTKSLISLASEAEETRNKFNVVFAGIRREADKAATNLQENFGLSSQASQQLLSDTGDLLTGFGLTREEALKLSDSAAQLGADLASFTNYAGGAKGATEALAAAMLGERERVKSLGIAIIETDLKKFASDQGKVWEQMSRGERAALTLQMALNQSKNAIGDFERSQDSFANVQRRVTARLQDMGAELGSRLLPALSKLGIAFLNASKDGGIIARIFDVITTSVSLAVGQLSVFINTLNAVSRESQIENIDKQLKELRVEYRRLRDEGIASKQELKANLDEQQRLIDLRGGEVNQIQNLNDSIKQLRETQKKELDTIQDIIAGREYELEKHEETETKKTEITTQQSEIRKQITIRDITQAAMASLSVMQSLTGQLGGILNQYITNRTQALDNQQSEEQDILDEQYEAQVEAINNSVLSEEEKAAKLKAIDEKKARDEEALNKEFEKRRRKLARDAAKKQKQLAIAETLITIPQMAVQAYKALAGIPIVGPVLGGIAAAAATALGLAKLALIKQQPLPAAAAGGVFNTPYIGGEAGKEMAVPLESESGRFAIKELAAGMLDVMSQQIDTRATAVKSETARQTISNVYLDGNLVGKWLHEASNNGIFTINPKVVVT